MNAIDPRLKTWGSERQGELVDAINKHGSQRKAALALGINARTLERSIQALRFAAALRGYSPEHDYTRPVPDTHVAKGVSTYYDADGNVRGQWVKSSLDDAKAAAFKRAALAALAEELPRLPALAGPGQTLDHLCNLYTLTDSHVGMLAWGRETGADWDLKIAEATLTGCFEHMVAAAPYARVALVNQLGDFMHYDGLLPVTPTHGHVLDADGRFEKMVEVAIRILRKVVDFALCRHEIVVLLLAEGNHDPASSVWLRHLFKALYENEPRIEVISSPLPYYAYQHGETMLAFHHGHLKKKDSLPLMMAAQFPQLWGATTKRYVHTGHMHHIEEKEHDGIIVHQHPTLAARDAYSARLGYVSQRSVTALTYHLKFGEVARNTVVPEMLEQ